jgi:hypothetical protein
MTTKAQFPSAGYSRPSVVAAEALVHTVYGETGEVLGDFDFSDIDAPRQLVSDLVTAFRNGTGSTGRWRSKSTVKEVASLLRRFSVNITSDNPDLQSLSDLTAEMWWAWRTKVKDRTRWPGQINMARCLLYEFHGLSPTTRRALSKREKKPKKRLFEAYSVKEYRRIYAAAWVTVRSARKRIRANHADLDIYRRGQEPLDVPTLPIKKTPWSRGELLDYISEHGRFPGGHIPYVRIDQFRELLRVEHPGSAAQALYASTAEVFAGIVLLVCERGFNLTVLNQLTAKPHEADVKPGEATVHALDKPRRGPELRFFNSSFSGKAGRIWRALAEITQPSRDFLEAKGEQTNLLLIGRVLEGSSCGKMFKSDWSQCRSAAASWQRMTGLIDDNGAPLTVDFRRLRLTEQVINQKSNQNSERVSESIYRRQDVQTKEIARDVILQGQKNALADAKAVIAVRGISRAEISTARNDPMHLAKELNVSVVRIKQLLNGEMDTVVTACTDFTESPFGQKGKACPASFLRCLECKNAVATPRHLPRLVLLHDAISALASAVSEAVWRTDYQASHERLSALLTNYSTSAERSDARRHTTDTDREAIRQLLNRRYDA